MLLFYLQHGLVLKKTHKAVSYRIEAFLKDYINFCAEKRREAKTKGDKFGDTFWKLAGNGVYGKTFECVRNGCNTKIMNGSDEKRLCKLFSQANYKDSEIIPDSNMVMVRMQPVEVILDKPIYVGAAILDKSKRDMYSFHYDYVMKTWPGRNSLLFTDTDSLTYWIETDDVYKDMLPAIKESLIPPNTQTTILVALEEELTL